MVAQPDLNTADGRHIARMLAAQDAAGSERISERVQRAVTGAARWSAVGADPLREVWLAVTALLTDPSRRTSSGNTSRWLGSGLYRCRHLDCIDAAPPATLTVNASVAGRYRTRRYRGGYQHLSRAQHHRLAVLRRTLSQSQFYATFFYPAHNDAVEVLKLSDQRSRVVFGKLDP